MTSLPSAPIPRMVLIYIVSKCITKASCDSKHMYRHTKQMNNEASNINNIGSNTSHKVEYVVRV